MRSIQQEIDAAAVLGLRTGSRMFRHAFTILGKPWRAEESTAQPPVRCGHECRQWASRRREHVCAACGISADDLRGK